MTIRTRLAASLAALALLCAGSAAPARADAVADFYKGRTITFTVVFAAGGTYGIYSQMGAKHLSRFIPGNPNIIVQHMTGAGGLKGTNYLYNAAPKDGTQIGMLSKDLAIAQVLDPEQVKFDAAKFNWVGSFNPYPSVVLTYAASGIRTVEDAKKKEVIIGTTGKASHGYMQPMLMNKLLGTKFKIVTGYRGTGDLFLAMERREIDGREGSFLALRSEKGDWLRDGKIHLLAQAAVKRHPALPDLPLLTEMAPDAESKAMFAVFDSSAVIGWSVAAPPGVPADRLAALRKAFDTAVRDPQMMDEMKKRQLDLEPAGHEDVLKSVQSSLALPPDKIAMLRSLLEM